KHPARVLVPDGKREHAPQMLHAALAVLLVKVDDRLRVAAAAEAMPAGLEQRMKLRVVVDLAVEDDPDGFVLVAHRLMAAGAVDDAKPGVPERHEVVAERARVVGPAMVERRDHR